MLAAGTSETGRVAMLFGCPRLACLVALLRPPEINKESRKCISIHAVARQYIHAGMYQRLFLFNLLYMKMRQPGIGCIGFEPLK